MLARVDTWLRTAQRRHRAGDDDGMSLVAVLGVMLIGFLAVAVVASATMFAITSTKTSADRTQALISAESGRDAVLAALASSCSPDHTYTGTDPAYTATVYVSDASTAPKDSTGLLSGCPGADTKFVVIRSEGTARGATATIDAVYPMQRETVRMGPGIGSTGKFSTNLSAYYGDLVVRDGDFSCLLASTVHGNVYVLNGDANLTLAACTITGDLRVSGKVTGLNLLGGVGGKIVAGESIRSPLLGILLPLVGRLGNFENTNPFVTPSKSEIEESISWFDLNEDTAWPGFERHEYAAGNCDSAVTSDIRTRLSTAGGPIVLDATGCTNTLSFLLKNLTVKRDAAILVDQGLTMPLSTLSADGSDRELYIVQTNTSSDPQHPAPNCAGRGPLEISPYSGLFQHRPKTLIYSPCSVNGFSFLTGTTGQVIAPDVDRFALLSSSTCVPFAVPGVFTLGCSITESTGGGEHSVGVLGRLLQQTES